MVEIVTRASYQATVAVAAQVARDGGRGGDRKFGDKKRSFDRSR
jgi:hypothetical protein